MKSAFLVVMILLFSNSTFSKDYGCDEINVQGQTYAVSSTDTSITVEEGNCSDDMDRALYGLIGAGILYWLVSSSTEDSEVQAFNDSNRIGIEYRFNNKYYISLSANKKNSLFFENYHKNFYPESLIMFNIGIAF